MDGEPAYRRDDPPDVGNEPDFVPKPPEPSGPGAFPVATLSIAFGLLAALVAIVSSGVLAAEGGKPVPGNGDWRLSAAAIAVIAAGWFAGALHLLFLVLPDRRGRQALSRRSGWPATLAALAVGPLLVALFFFGTGLTRFPAYDVVTHALAAVIILALLFARRSVRLLAERLLLSFFLWMGILVVPTFWRDPVSAELSTFLFGLLRAVGLLA